MIDKPLAITNLDSLALIASPMLMTVPLMVFLLWISFLDIIHTFKSIRMTTHCSLLILLLAFSMGAQAAISHLNPKNYQEKLQETPFTLVYYYSSSCQFCKQFTPVFEKLAKNETLAHLGIGFAKIDGPAYENFSHDAEVYSYPSLLFYQQGVDLPIHIRRAREERDLLAELEQLVKTSDLPNLL